MPSISCHLPSSCHFNSISWWHHPQRHCFPYYSDREPRGSECTTTLRKKTISSVDRLRLLPPLFLFISVSLSLSLSLSSSLSVPYFFLSWKSSTPSLCMVLTLFLAHYVCL